jgi:hypothetical protein
MGIPETAGCAVFDAGWRENDDAPGSSRCDGERAMEKRRAREQRVMPDGQTTDATGLTRSAHQGCEEDLGALNDDERGATRRHTDSRDGRRRTP